MQHSTHRDRIIDRIRERPAVSVSLLTCIGFLLRFYQIDQQSLWLDEISSLRNARAFGAGGIVALAAIDQVAPLHSIVLWMATVIGGESALTLRTPSAIAGTLMIPAMYMLVRRFSFDRATAYVATLITCISPLLIWYSQEARMYVFVALCATLYVAVAWPIVSRRLSGSELAALFVIAVAGLGFHHYMAFVILLYGLFLLARGQVVQSRFWIWSITQFCAVLVFAAWMALTYKSIGGAAGTAKPFVLFWIPYTIYAFLLGFSLGPSPREIATAGSSLAGYTLLDAILIVVAATAGAIILVHVALRDLRIVIRQWHSPEAARVLLVWMWLLVPILLALGMTFITKVQFNVRYTVVSYPAFVLVLSLGMREFVHGLALRGGKARQPGEGGPMWAGPRYAAVASAVILALLTASIVNHYYNERYEKEDSRTLSDILKTESPGAILIANNALVAKPLEYYKGPIPDSSLTIDYRLSDSTPDSVFESLTRRLLPAGSRIVFIEYRGWESDKGNLLRKKLDNIGTVVKEISLPGVTVIEYSIRRGPVPG